MGWLGDKRIKKLDNLRRETALVDRKLYYQERTAAYLSGAWFPGGYTSATITTGGKQPNGLDNSGMTRLFDHRALRANTRDAMYDSIHARAIITRFADTIAGEGLRARFEPNARVLGRTEMEMEEWGRDVSERFHLFMSSKDYSTDGTLNGYQSQWLYALCQQRDNDVYARLHYERGRGRISPLSVQHMDPDQLRGYAYTPTEGSTNFVNDAISYDGKGREQAFTFIVKNPDGTVEERQIPKFGSRSGKQYIIHGFRPEYSGQREGYSLYAHALQRFEELTTLHHSYLGKAILESTIGGWTKPSKDAPASGGMEDFAKESVDVVEDLLSGTDASPETKEELRQTVMRTFPELAVRQPGSVWVANAGAGEEIMPFKADTPHEAFSIFIDNVCEYLGASTGMGIEFLKNKFGQNYSASRAMLVLIWRVINMWRAEMISDYLNIIAQAWLGEEIAAGRIQAPGWSDPLLRAAWMNIRWVGSSMPNIDPKKEAEARKLNVLLGSTTLDDCALEHNGSDGKRNRAQLRREYGELTLPPWESGGGGFSDGTVDVGRGNAGSVPDGAGAGQPR